LSNNASGIHLATHAVANNDDPSRSYIAFYADKAGEGKLYAHELRNAPLSNVQLAFLSACETASGKIVSGEGIMSLSRAFSVAGCSNIVTSLWKAEDNATAYISIKFYDYLRRGYSPSQALQKAKLDLLLDGRYAQFHSPQYWSHLVFVGIPYESENFPGMWIWIACILVAGSLAVGWFYTKKTIHKII
jgi:CHAT domain-containing protein